MLLSITQSLLDALVARASESHPRECCGLLLGDDGNISGLCPARNVHPDPESRFDIDPQVLIDAHRAARGGGPKVIGYYHSHPAGPARPSMVDQQQSARNGAIWAIIGTDGDVTFWRDDEHGFAPLPYRCLDA